MLVVKNPPANAGDRRDAGSISGLGRSPGVGNGTPLSILAWKIPWAEEPGRLQSMGLQRVGHDLAYQTSIECKTQNFLFQNALEVILNYLTYKEQWKFQLTWNNVIQNGVNDGMTQRLELSDKTLEREYKNTLDLPSWHSEQHVSLIKNSLGRLNSRIEMREEKRQFQEWRTRKEMAVLWVNIIDYFPLEFF